MIDIITWETAHQFGEALPAMLRLRHRIFVDRQRYAVPTHRGMEWDQFDTPTAVYLCWRDNRGQPRGITRLLPTTRPYMIQELWPDLIGSEALPCDDTVWEWTRFGVDHEMDSFSRERVTGKLLCACMEFGLQNGVKSYLFVTPKLIAKEAYKRLGVPIELFNRDAHLGGFTVTAGRIPVTKKALDNLRRRYRIDGSVLRQPHTAPHHPAHPSTPRAAAGRSLAATAA